MKEITVPEYVEVLTLAILLDVPAARLIQTAYEDLGRLLTIHELLPFEEARALLAHCGYIAHRRRDRGDGVTPRPN